MKANLADFKGYYLTKKSVKSLTEEGVPSKFKCKYPIPTESGLKIHDPSFTNFG